MDRTTVPGTGSALPETQNSPFIIGNGVKVTYDESAGTLTLYRLDGVGELPISKPSPMGYPMIDAQAILDFVPVACEVARDSVGQMGPGQRMTITTQSVSTGLQRICVLETALNKPGVVYTQTDYRAEGAAVTLSCCVDSVFELAQAAHYVWSYQGGGEGPANCDTIRKLDLDDAKPFCRENIHDYTAASIPVADIYTAQGGIAVGDASATRREVHTPVRKTTDSVEISIKWPGRTLAAGDRVTVGQSFIIVHGGDYFNGLRGYKEAMESLGIVMPTKVADRSYQLRWESWGWGFNWTVDLIINKLDELETMGVKQITLDDGWYDSPGDWGLKPEKFPNGIADMRRLTDAIHAHGMSALLWWRPCDGGRDSRLYREHPEYYVKDEAGNPILLKGAGVTDSTYQDTSVMGYALCPGSPGAIASQLSLVNRAMQDWGFDGFKQDYVWSMPKCYSPDHDHPYPEDSTETQSEFYRTAWESMVANDPDCFNLLCNCGSPQDYYSLRYMTQVVTADPISVDQTRRRVKAYKALMGDYFPVTTDHNHVWYPSTIGTGAVLVERRALIGSGATKYARWMGIANELELHKGRFIGDLYSYGFDPYETYVVEKDGALYYAFYRDGDAYQPDGYPELTLRGLAPDKLYRIVDYVNNRVVATNLKGDSGVFNSRFATELLVKAVELAVPDTDPVDTDWSDDVITAPEPIYEKVDALSDEMTYTGSWQVDYNEAFYNGNTKYTDQCGASASLTFTGTAIRWYGQTSMRDYATADIHLDDVQIEAAFAYGVPATGQLLFELTGLPLGEHTLRITHFKGHLTLDYLAYATEG